MPTTTQPTTNYLDRIAAARTRFEAADLIRAWGARTAARSYCYSDADRVSIIEQHEQQAQSLERDYSLDGDRPIPESQHPWRRWLREWGYPMRAEVA